MSYGVVQGKIWRSPSVRGLSKDLKLAWVYLLANEHSNMLGYYLLPLPYMADDLEWTIEETEKAVKDLERRGLISYDQEFHVMFICKHLKYNTLSSGARETGAIARIRSLPASPLLSRLSRAICEWQPGLRNLRACLKQWSPQELPLGLPEVPSRSPRGPLDTGVVVDAVVGIGVEDVEPEDTSSTQHRYSHEFTDFWIVYPRTKQMNKFQTWKAWKKCLAGRPGENGHDPIDPQRLINGAMNYAVFCANEKRDESKIMYPGTFLGPDQHWEQHQDQIELRASVQAEDLTRWVEKRRRVTA